MDLHGLDATGVCLLDAASMLYLLMVNRQGVSTQHDWQSVDPSGERVASPPLQRRLDQLQAQKQAIKRGRGEL